MSLLLLDNPIIAAVSPRASVNLLSRIRASAHAVNSAVCSVELPLTVCFLGQAVSTTLSFVISDDDLGFEIILGSEWQSWCTTNKGQTCQLPLLLSFSFVLLNSALSFANGGRSTSCLS